MADPYDNPSESSGLADILEIATAIEEKATPLRAERARPVTAAVPLAPRMAPAALPSSGARPPSPGFAMANPWTAADVERVAAQQSASPRHRTPTALWAAVGGLSVLVVGGIVAMAWPRATPPTATPEAPPATASASIAAPSNDVPPPAPVADPTPPGPPSEAPTPTARATPDPIHGQTHHAEAPSQASASDTKTSHSRSAPVKTAEDAPHRVRPKSSASASPKSSPSGSPTPAPSVDAEPPVDSGKKFSTECILDPSLPGCSAAKAGKAEAAPPKAPDVNASLPDKLSQTQIRDGIEPFKAKAKACGDRHGAPADTTIRIKLSIEGASGKITSASATEGHAGQPLGQCVADALKSATFPRFKSTAQGTTFPVKL